MLNNFRTIQSLFWSHGLRWLLFRLGYALRKRTGLLRRQMPVYRWNDRPLESWLKKDIPSTPQAYADWRKQNSPRFFIGSRAERSRTDSGGAVDARIPKEAAWNPHTAVDQAEKIVSGKIRFFSHEYHRLGFPPDWHLDPVTGKRLSSQDHWSGLSNDPGVDIKFIWEPSRFGMVYPLVRAYASTRDEKYAQAFWDLVQAWVESNPPNTGPNWMDGQEAALRLIAWTFGFYGLLDSPSTTSERTAQFVVMVAAHAERIHKNIAYAISTRGNHIISEAAGLWIAGLLFPELRQAEKYLSLGRELLEREAAAQIFPDGTYSMYSLNYHRFILHTYLLVLRLAETNQSPISSLIFERVSSSIDFLSRLIDPRTGQMPVYGSNDGALVLPLNDCDFTDYRPLLQLGWYGTKKKLLFEPGPWDEDVYWFYGEKALFPGPSSEERPRSAPSGGGRGKDEGGSSFPYGGIHLLHGPDSKAVIRCTGYRARPSHADQLHVDLWLRGQNIACDAGTYLYSGQDVWRNGLAHTAVHNTVTVDHQDQMKMLTRFTWTEWSTGTVLRHEKRLWQGEHDGYQRLPDPVSHKRTVVSLGEDRWLVVDHLAASQPHHYDLHWLLTDREYGVQEFAPGSFSVLLDISDGKPSDAKIFIQTGLLSGHGNFSTLRADPASRRGWRSQYYGHKEPAISLLLEAKQPAAIFYTFFGFENDALNLDGHILKVQAGDLQKAIDLNSPSPGVEGSPSI